MTLSGAIPIGADSTAAPRWPLVTADWTAVRHSRRPAATAAYAAAKRALDVVVAASLILLLLPLLLLIGVAIALESGLHLIFVWSAIIMVLAIPLHLLLRSEPLRTRVVEPELAAP